MGINRVCTCIDTYTLCQLHAVSSGDYYEIFIGAGAKLYMRILAGGSNDTEAVSRVVRRAIVSRQSALDCKRTHTPTIELYL